MNFKSVSVAALFAVGISSAALAQSNSGTNMNSGDSMKKASVPTQGGAAGAPPTGGTMQGKATNKTGNNDNGTMSGNPTTTSGAPTNAGKTK